MPQPHKTGRKIYYCIPSKWRYFGLITNFEQHFFGLPKSKAWLPFFKFATFFGNEELFAAIFPLLMWFVDEDLGTRTCAIWGISLFIGELLKDTCKLPRPSSPPVIRLENSYANEHGLPSTHASSSICIAGYLNYYLYTRYEGVPLWLCIAIVTVCSATISLNIFLDLGFIGLRVARLLGCAFAFGHCCWFNFWIRIADCIYSMQWCIHVLVVQFVHFTLVALGNRHHNVNHIPSYRNMDTSLWWRCEMHLFMLSCIDLF